MTNYEKLNNLLGWLVCGIATVVYGLTVEPTASFWDAGEFIAAAYKLQVPHPPGAPFYLLIGRFFSLFAPDEQTVALFINFVSVISSAFTILFLFWTITIFGKKLVQPEGKPLTKDQALIVLGSGIVGALAFTFTDSFWFSAVEAEVYAMSSFFTAVVFWAILKWENRFGLPGANKWLLLIAYLVGLSIGVHLLNLVAIPALAFVYYFKKYEFSWTGALLTLVISAGLIGVIMVGIIPGLPSIARAMEIFFVNDLSLPFNSGVIFFGLLVIGLLAFGIYYSIKEGYQWLNLGLLALTFILIGYSSYGIILIRSGYDPPIDENDPENANTFVSYLKREQYGDRPLLKGHYYTAGQPIDFKKGDPMYIKDEKAGKYVVYDYKVDYEYDPAHTTIFPRMHSTQPNHINAYVNWAGQPKDNVAEKSVAGRDARPAFFSQNLGFFFNYQIGHMYLRYFGWNFIGRESDIQGAGILSPFNAMEKVPDYIKENKARNNFYLLPLILGIFGMVFQFMRRSKDAGIVLLLFFFSGLAIIIYLNQPPIEPRERDYTYTGSFYAFSIWIGLGCMALWDLLKQLSGKSLPAVATVLCLSVPVVMAAEGWDDHDRSNRYHSVDSAKNLLSSVAPNGILFTGGDNDTFPLWYAQEVEGFRTDVRVVNLSLLNTDWYIEQMKRQAYESDPLPISFEKEHYIQGTFDHTFIQAQPQFGSGINLDVYLSLLQNKDRNVTQTGTTGSLFGILPSRTLFVPINQEKLKNADFIPEELKSSIPDKFQWTLDSSRTGIDKKDLIILDIIAKNNWERPIYFSTTLSPSDFLELKPYTQLEGLAHRLMPVKRPGSVEGWVNVDSTYKHLMKDFSYRNLDNPDVYYDENYLRFPLNLRQQFRKLAATLISQGKIDSAKAVLNKNFEAMPHETIPFDITVPDFIPLLFKVGEDKKAVEVATIMGDRAIEDLEYLSTLKETELDFYEVRKNAYILDMIIQFLKQYNQKDLAAKYQEQYQALSQQFQ